MENISLNPKELDNHLVIDINQIATVTKGFVKDEDLPFLLEIKFNDGEVKKLEFVKEEYRDAVYNEITEG